MSEILFLIGMNNLEEPADLNLAEEASRRRITLFFKKMKKRNGPPLDSEDKPLLWSCQWQPVVTDPESQPEPDGEKGTQLSSLAD
ncbi:Hypothetical predicted protein [Mytilus galloprovincialis]|uniref:Uncharacterized protein n=1 Tax=Mytilus galloprovincialis TaxID=29158 RepID=A0A8B6GH75_MYTGA|nr:Hypothetical predicted protein [Mytilus galloprovincialis]